VTAIEQLASAGTAVRVFIPGLDAVITRRIASAGAVVETAPVSLDDLTKRTSLVVFHGSLGTASFALAAGIPQIIVALDTEKRLIGRAIERLGAGRCVTLSDSNPLEGALLAQFILETSADESLRAVARSIAPGFRQRLREDPAEKVAQKVVRLAG
jgi:UDP:flavonoid glycosyltransferase YjiC (YdhE family)